MNITQKTLAACSALILLPASGAFAQDADLGYAEPSSQMSGSDFFTQIASHLRWSANFVYAQSQEKGEWDSKPTLGGVALDLSYFVDENKEAYAGVAYLYGSGELRSWSRTYDVDINRIEVFGGFNYHIEINDKFGAYVGARVGVAQTTEYTEGLSSSDYSSNDMAIFGALGGGLTYSVSENIRVLFGIEYNTYLQSFQNDYYENDPYCTYVMGKLGVEFKF